MSHISFYMKSLGQRSAGKPHAALDVAGVGNVLFSSDAPVLDPTCEKLGGKFPLLTRPNPTQPTACKEWLQWVVKSLLRVTENRQVSAQGNGMVAPTLNGVYVPKWRMQIPTNK